MAAQQSPAEFALEIFKYDTEVMRHLVFWESDYIDNASLPKEAHDIAIEIANGIESHASAATAVLSLYQLDKKKRTALQLLEGVNL
jgi:hypothetical protein